MTPPATLDTVYDPRSVEPDIYARWERSGAFRSNPADPPTPHDRTFTIVIPPPNVTGALHLGHALNNTLQDILVRYHRMRGFNTLWQPGTDHAGIATQAVVERRIREQDGKTRHELGREELVRRIWQWKDEYESRILSQLKLMGCSCDWERTRFTLDEGLAKAVREMFFRLFKAGLIFRGKRLVNWDTQLQTAVSDDEVYYVKVKGDFWHIKYPVIDPKPGEPDHVVIATTRPETMLGDTAVAVHPDPAAFFDRQTSALTSDLETARARSSKDAGEIKAKLEALAARRETHLDRLIKLRDMAGDGRRLRLPLVEREIPLIADEWADPTKGSGCVKITPAHDPNDYEVALRHELPMINVLTPDGMVARIVEPDGTVNARSGQYEGLAFSAAGRKKVVADLEARGLLVEVEDHDVEVGHSDRSKLPIEPFLSDQWFVRTGDAQVTLADRRTASGLAPAAMGAVTEGKIEVVPSRYAKSYLDWLGEKRDWCISRQLWWGHRIPIWVFRLSTARQTSMYESDVEGFQRHLDESETALRRFFAECEVQDEVYFTWPPSLVEGSYLITVCCGSTRSADAVDGLGRILSHKTTGNCEEIRKVHETNEAFKKEFGADAFSAIGKLRARVSLHERDPDVLDTWFSSALWPFSTLGWPEDTPHLKQYYPGSVLVTNRDIITNWVARMVMFGLYARGDVPFDRVYIHPKILDGRGETMSKSKGNGVDPVDIIHTHGADALRFAMADMCTETQDIRVPVEYICPHCGKLTSQDAAIKAETQRRKSRGETLQRKLQPADCVRVTCSNKTCGKAFATQWADESTKGELGLGRETSDKFDIGRNFCNKLWNAARFALMNLDGAPCDRLDIDALPPEDRWVLARLSQSIRRYHECMRAYQFSASIRELREFFWDALCDWYIELTKPRLTGGAESTSQPDASATAKQVLAFCLDQVLRLWHPTLPFITETLWQHLNEVVPRRGLPGVVDLTCDTDLITAPFPPVEGYPALDDDAITATFRRLQAATRGVRDIRANCGVSPKESVTATVVVPQGEVDALKAQAHIVEHMAKIGTLTVSSQSRRPKNAGSLIVGDMRIYVHDISDDDAERARITKQLESVQKQVRGKQSKLANERFVANADPTIVEAERQRLAHLLVERTNLQQHLADLGE